MIIVDNIDTNKLYLLWFHSKFYFNYEMKFVSWELNWNGVYIYMVIFMKQLERVILIFFGYLKMDGDYEIENYNFLKLWNFHYYYKITKFRKISILFSLI